MNGAPTRYPLQWPAGWKRTPGYHRKGGKFRNQGRPMTVAAAVQRVLVELDRLGVNENDVVISTNLRTRLDGLPRSDQGRPGDVGVAVYWQKPRQDMRCMAVDAYDEVEDNLAAIAATLEAMRAIERHGGAAILDRAFTGFTALPAPVAGRRDWWTVLELQQSASRAEIEQAHRRLASKYHPDKPEGNADRMAEVNTARDQALGEVSR